MSYCYGQPQTLADEMNLALIDPFQLAQDSPDALVDEFSKSIYHSLTASESQETANNAELMPGHQTDPLEGSGHATTLRFSRKGDYLASGRVDGKVVIW
jgi:hypothetical protein